MLCLLSDVVLLMLLQSEEKCAKLQASLNEADEKLSSKFPANGTSSQSGTAAGASQVQMPRFVM